MATWAIANLERNIADGGVTVAHWRCDADGASVYGTVGFTPDATDPAFKPFDQLTEADVLAWVWESVDKEATEAALQSQIDAIANPVTATGTPWE